MEWLDSLYLSEYKRSFSRAGMDGKKHAIAQDESQSRAGRKPAAKGKAKTKAAKRGKKKVVRRKAS